MTYIKKKLEQIFSLALAKSFPALSDVFLEITSSNQPKLADYQCNSAMKLAKQVQTNPRDFATRLIAEIHDDFIENLEVAGPGFINIRLSRKVLAEHLTKMLSEEKCGVHFPELKGERIIVEFSSPNTAKQMHVGHLRSTIIGDCIARVFEFLDADVLRLNHVGDWGTQFGMLIAFLKAEHPKVLSGSESADLTALAAWYKAAKKRFDEDEAFKKCAQQEVVTLQSGQAESLSAWKKICTISRENYQAIYDLLGVKLNERGESFYNPFLAEVVEDLTRQGFVKVSDGAKCIFLEGFVGREGEPLPLIIQKSDGGYNYASTDLAAMRHRAKIEKAERIIILTDAGQSLHFEMVSKVAQSANYLTSAQNKPVRFDHVTFGLVLGEDGKKIKTRAGDSEPLINLILTAIDEAKKVIHAREHDLTPDEANHLAKVLGVNAIKYADLSCNRIGDYKFSYEKMLRFEGNTAAFLMYAYVRTVSIRRKVGEAKAALAKEISLAHPSEVALGLHLARFDEVIAQLVEDLQPHRLCDYLYQLAEYFNAFFRDCRVEGVAEESSRLALCALTSKVLLAGMQLLGLTLVQKM